LDFRLQANSPAWKLGFKPIPVERIGLQTNMLRPNLPPRELFEADLIVEQAPVMRSGKCCKPGVVRARVRKRVVSSSLARDFRLTARNSSGDSHLSFRAGHMEIAP